MPSSRASVVGPVALDKVLRFVTLALVIPGMLFALACGGGHSTTTPPVGPSPTFTSTAPQIASEGIQYLYNITTTTPDNSTVTYKVTGPTGAAISGSALTWTPTHAQARVPNTFEITATTSNNGVFSQTFILTPTGIITGSAVDYAVAGGTLVDYPQDMSAVTVEVLLPNNKGGFNHLAGTGDASGNFTIANVPAGNYWLHLQRMDNGAITDNYLYTSSSDIDAGQLVIGRPDAVHATAGVTIAAQNIALSVPVTSSDSMAWVSPDAKSSGAPAAPASQTYSATFSQTGGLINSAKGDKGYLLHYTTSGLITRVVESESFPSLTETNGGTTTLTGSMTASTGSTTDPVVKISEFDAVNTAIPGYTTPIAKNFTMFDSGYDGSNGFLPTNLYAASGSTPIQLIKIPLSTVTTDTDFGSIPYGLVTAAGVLPFAQLEDLGSRSFSIGGSNYTFQNNGQVTITDVIPSSSNSTFPVVGEPLNPTVDGKDFFTNQGSISGAPQVAWTTPTFGTPSSYELTVVNPSTLGGANPEIHYFYTFSTGVAIPPGILKANTSYVFIVQAMMFQANNFKAAPFRMGTNAAWTSEVSAVMTTNSTGASTVRAHTSASSSGREVFVTPGANGTLSVRVNKK